MTTAMRPGVSARLTVQGRLAPNATVDLTPRWGRDVTGALHLEVDATGWVTDVRIDALPDPLRQTVSFEAAIRSAIADAMWQHVVAEAESLAASATQDDLDRGRALLEGRASIRVPRVVGPPRTSVEQTRADAARRDVSPAREDARVFRQSTGTSREGEITVRMGWVDGLQSVRTDARWLAAAQASMVRYALREAFTAVARAGDDQA